MDTAERGRVFGSGEERELILCADREWRPDETKAYVECSLSHSVPVITFYGECLSPWTIQNSYRSMLHQGANLGHKVRAYDPENVTRDRFVGCVVAAEFAVTGGLRVPSSVAEAPGIRAVMSIFKLAEGVDRVIGAHQAGRQAYTVSMEVRYNKAESGFLIAEREPEGQDLRHTTTDPWRRQGWLYVPYAEADLDLVEQRDWSRNRMKATRRDGGRGYCGYWKDRPVYWLMGGLEGEVHYSGIGLVSAGAEPTARIEQMLAENEEETAMAECIEQLRVAVEGLLGAV